MSSTNDKQLLQYKKVKFLSFVEKSAEYHNVKIPQVKFWEEYDNNHFDHGERAHIHIETNTICIAEPELRNMTEEEIQETASHEVTHLYDLGHGNRFESKRVDTEASLWRPPSGTMHIVNEKVKSKKSDYKEGKPDRVRCNYHQCRKKVKLTQCKHCKKYFCEKHRKPKPPTMFLGKDSSINAQLLMEEYKKEDAHPCVSYVDFWRNKKLKESEKWGKTLDILSGRHSRQKGVQKTINEDVEENSDYDEYKDSEYLHDLAIKNLKTEPVKKRKINQSPLKPFKKKKNKKKRNYRLLKIIGIIFAILILVYVLNSIFPEDLDPGFHMRCKEKFDSYIEGIKNITSKDISISTFDSYGDVKSLQEKENVKYFWDKSIQNELSEANYPIYFYYGTVYKKTSKSFTGIFEERIDVERICESEGMRKQNKFISIIKKLIK